MKKAYCKYILALLLFGSNGIAAISGASSCGFICGGMSAVVFAALLLHESMTAMQIIGAVCIIGGAMLGELVKAKPSSVQT